MTRGLIVGRFMPPHAGHQWLVETALALVDRLTILVLWQADDPIPGPLRLAWMREMFPRARIVDHGVGHRDGVSGGVPAEQPDWRSIVRGVHPDPVDFLFSSAPGDMGRAAEIGARGVLVDPDHACMAVASRAIRADPLAHWRFLPDVARPHFARTICLHGPESTGKSTLAPLLARHFDTIFVPEYGRTYCEQQGLDLTMADLVTIGRTHAAMTHAALRRCHRRLILDTDPLMTAAWADMLFGTRDPWFDAFGATADLYLLLDIDVPWVDDGSRFFGQAPARRRFFDLSRAELDRRGLRYEVIGGTPEERLARAIDAIARL